MTAPKKRGPGRPRKDEPKRLGRPPKVEPKKRGRPKTKPKSAEELRAKAQQKIHECAMHRKGLDTADVGEFIAKTGKITGKHKFTKEEMDDIRTKLDLLYREYVVEQQDKEAEKDAPYVETLRAEALKGNSKPSPGFMTPEKWAEEHGIRVDGKQKPGPKPKRKKLVYELEPGERGNGLEPAPPIDIEAMEKEIADQMMERHLREKEYEKRFLKGKRLREMDPGQIYPPVSQKDWV